MKVPEEEKTCPFRVLYKQCISSLQLLKNEYNSFLTNIREPVTGLEMQYLLSTLYFANSKVVVCNISSPPLYSLRYKHISFSALTRDKASLGYYSTIRDKTGPRQWWRPSDHLFTDDENACDRNGATVSCLGKEWRWVMLRAPNGNTMSQYSRLVIGQPKKKETCTISFECSSRNIK